MGREPERANFDGISLASLRNIPASFFLSEDPTLGTQSPFIPEFSIPLDPYLDLGPESNHAVGELGNDTLPAFDYRKKIPEVVRDHPISFVVAETGAGKSTQIPQFLLNAGWDTIYLTQPRRAAARNVYNRIHYEVGVVRGEDEADKLVSYQTAGEREGSEDARIKVVTDGLQLVRELHDKGITENDVLIIDEVHEQNSNIEVLVGWVKQIVAENPQLRVVIMSATMDAQNMADYFADVCPSTPPIIEIPGRTYNVERSEKPESTVVKEVIEASRKIHLAQEDGYDGQNGILAFVPGTREIQDSIDEIRRGLPSDIRNTATILPLHAKLSQTQQQAAFQAYPGVKITVSTNLAQTSLTIPDTKYVIDSGLQRREELDDEGTKGLILNTISQADCDQRAGRAGRVSDGFYILTRLDAKTPFIPYDSRPKYPTPEILRTDIVRNTLRIADRGTDIAAFGLYNKVKPIEIQRAQNTLQLLGALDGSNLITPLGRQMNQFPVCATSARMLVEAGRYSDQTRAYLSAIVAAKEIGGLQNFEYGAGKNWKELTEEESSDLLAQLDMFIAIQDMTPLEILSQDLDLYSVDRAREQYRKIAKQVGALREKLLPPTIKEREEIKQCIYAGLVGSIYRYAGNETYIHVGDSDTPRKISNRSVVRDKPSAIVGDPYRVEFIKRGVRGEKHVVEHVTAATMADLGRVAAHLTKWKPDGLTMRNGRFMDIMRLSLFDVDLGTIKEVPAEPSTELRESAIAYALEHAGKAQGRLRGIKTELQRLAHIAKDPVDQLTHDQIVALVREAAPDDVTDTSIIDNNLRIMMDSRGITLDSFVSPERQEDIAANAPSVIEVGNVALNLTYRNSHPLIRKIDQRDLMQLSDEVVLADGRQVLFMHRGNRYTLAKLKEELALV